MTKTLKNFLKKHDVDVDVNMQKFAKDLTLEQFLETCKRGDWILWLFAKTNPESLRELTLAKGHCAATVLDLMLIEKSKKAVQAAIDFGNFKIGEEELDVAAEAADVTADTASFAAYAAASDAEHDHAASFAASAVDDDDYKKNQAQTADICRKYLPLEIWSL